MRLWALLLLVLLAACGNQQSGGAPPPSPGFPGAPPIGGGPTPPPGGSPPGGGGGLSGTVYLGQTIPQGTVRGTYVFALYYDPQSDAIDEGKSKWVQVGQDGRQAPYSLTSLQAGYYLLLGWKDVDGDRQVSGPDYLGLYQDPQGNYLVTPGRSGLNLTLEVAGAYGYAHGQTGTSPLGRALGALRVPAGR